MMRASWEATLPSSRHKHVLVALAWHANDEGTNCYPSIQRLSTMTQLGERQVQRILKDLRESGEVEVVTKERGWRTPRYYLKGCHERRLGVTSTTLRNGSRGDTDNTPGVTRATPPNRNRQRNHQRGTNHQGKDDSQILWLKRRYERGKKDITGALAFVPSEVRACEEGLVTHESDG